MEVHVTLTREFFSWDMVRNEEMPEKLDGIADNGLSAFVNNHGISMGQVCFKWSIMLILLRTTFKS